MIDEVLIERHSAVAIVTINLPQKRKRNALDMNLVEALIESLTQLQDSTDIRALVLSGGRHICASGDLSALAKAPLQMRRGMQMGHRIVRALTTGPLPVVAAVQGDATPNRRDPF